MNLEETVKVAVRKQIFEQTSVNSDGEKLNENYGRIRHIALSTAAGVGMGVSLGRFAAVQGAMSIHSFGLVSASTLFPMITGIAIGGAIAGAIIGGVMGYRSAQKIAKTDTDFVLVKLINVTNSRDAALTKLIKKPENKRIQREIENLTQKQKKIAIDLEQAMKTDRAKDVIDDTDVKYLKRLLRVAKQGKLTYLEK